MKKAISIAIVLAILVTAAAPAFADYLVGKNGYVITGESDAQYLWERGLFLGSNGSFRLDDPMTRAEAAVMLVRLLGATGDAVAQKNTHPFTDVPDWADEYVGYLYKNGLTNGTSATKYGSGSNITANQYITLLLRVLGYQDSVDFVWDSAAKSALDFGIIGEPCYLDYTTAPVFMRDLAARVSVSFLMANKKGTQTPLIDTITLPGRPEGDMPVASKFIQEPVYDGAATITQVSGNLNVAGNQVVYVLLNCTKTGLVKVTVTCGSDSASVSYNMEQGKAYGVSFGVNIPKHVIYYDPYGRPIPSSDGPANRAFSVETSSGSTYNFTVYTTEPSFTGNNTVKQR